MRRAKTAIQDPIERSRIPRQRAATQRGIADVSGLGHRQPRSATLAHHGLHLLRLAHPSVHLVLLIYSDTYSHLPSHLGTSWREGLHVRCSPIHFQAHVLGLLFGSKVDLASDVSSTRRRTALSCLRKDVRETIGLSTTLLTLSSPSDSVLGGRLDKHYAVSMPRRSY